MATLARMRQMTEQLRARRRVFLSSAPVSAYKVAHNQKQLLSGEHPLALALPPEAGQAGYPAASAAIDLLEASVGPELTWDLTAVNHVMRTMSKYGEPTYLFAGIVDTDPQAFVAVTLHKRTPDDELEHLESVLGRVCQLHYAETKPMQVPGPDQVVASLGKGLMKLLLGGGGGGGGSKHRDHDSQAGGEGGAEPPSAGLPVDTRSPARERAEYLASLERGGGGGGGTAAGYELEGEEMPTASIMDAPAPDVHATGGRRDQGGARAAAAYPAVPGGRYGPYAPQQPPSSEPQPGWQEHAPGTLSNLFTGGAGAAAAPAPPPGAPPAGMSYDDYLQRDEEWGGSGRRAAAHHGAGGGSPQGGRAKPAAPQPTYGGYSQGMADWDARLESAAGAGGGGGAAPLPYYGGGARQAGATGGGSDDGAGGAPRGSSSRVKYAPAARESWEEWQRVQREAAAKAGGGGRYAYAGGSPAGDDDSGWGSGGRAAAQLEQQQRQRDQEQQQRQQRKAGAPDWLETLGRVFAGAPARAGQYAPNL